MAEPAVARRTLTPTPSPAALRPPSSLRIVAPASPARTDRPPPVGALLGGLQGEPLPQGVSTRIGSSLGVDVSPVRVQANAAAAAAADAFGARAFTFGNTIFLGRGERPTDLPLMAHEAAHAVQQRGAAALQPWTAIGGDRYEREAQSASSAIVQGLPFTVSERVTPRVQRLGIGDALDYFADKAYLIPGFRMFTIILGVNPINMSRVERSAANILRALIEFIPGGALITHALDNHGIFAKVGAWVEQQIATLGMTGAVIKNAIAEFLGSLGWRDIFDLGGVWERAKRIFTEPIRRIIDFASSMVAGIVKFIKDAILLPLAKLAEGTRGWDLLTAVLGKNPITGAAVPRTAETLIGGFMKLIGQDEVWANMKKANAIGRAWAWFQTALGELMAFVAQIPTMAINAFKSLELLDIVLVPRAFAKVATVFGGFLMSFIGWAGNTVWKLLEIVFDVVSPGAWGYVKKTGAALRSILKNPLPFVGNLVRAAKLGFQNFATNIGAHLKAALLDWLTGSLPGVYIPKSFSLGELVKFVLSVLGLSWANVRQKLVKLLGETAVAAMEGGFKIVVTLVTEGPAAAWEQMKEQLSNLKDQVIGGITDMVVEMVLTKAVPKLIAMFIPGAGFISAIISIYDTIMVFVQKIAKIIQVVKGFIDSIVSIAAGVITAAAKRVESTLAGLLSLAISFLAGFAGLGKVADKIMGVINKIRAPIDKALDALVNWIVTMAKKLFAKVFGKKEKPDDRSEEQKVQAVRAAVSEVEAAAGATPDRRAIQQRLAAIRAKYRLTSLSFEDLTGGSYRVVAEINPRWPSRTYPPGETRYTIVENGERVLRPEYRGAQPIRRRLYSSSNRGPTQRIIKKRVTPLIRQLNPATNTWEPAPSFDQAQYWEPTPGQVVSLRDERTKPTLAHDLPVVGHWNQTGNNTDQTTRIDFYHFKGKEDVARVLMFYLNREEGAGGEGDYTHKVGPGFKEPGE